MGASDRAGLTRVRLLKSDAFRKPGSRLWASRSFAAYGQPFNEGLIEVVSARVNPFRYKFMKAERRDGGFHDPRAGVGREGASPNRSIHRR